MDALDIFITVGSILLATVVFFKIYNEIKKSKSQ